MEKEPLVLALLDNPQLCLSHFELSNSFGEFDEIPKIEQKQRLFKKCPSLFIEDKFKGIENGHLTGPFEDIINAENDMFCSLGTFRVIFMERNALKALRKQRLLENIFMDSEDPQAKGDLNVLIDGILEC